ncbi:MAG: serine/threonine-protein kinase [Planctomycetota bacterium]
MLSPADVVTAKLLCQVQAASPDQVRAAMRALAQTPAGGSDLVGFLQEQGILSGPVAAKLRRYQALFEHIRLEGVYLRMAEKSDPPLDRLEVAEVLARIEADSYRARIGEVLVRMGRLSPAAARDLDRKAREKLQKEDLKVLERYAAEDFAGVARPLLPVSVVETGIFKVSTLFRGKETRRNIKRLSAQLANLDAAPIGPAELLPQDYSDEAEISPEARAEHARRSTARFRAKQKTAPLGAPVDEPSLEQRRSIGVYEVVECVGQGGMGAVYLAQEEGMGPMAAVKVMLKERAAPDDLARFEREIALMARIDHPRVARLLDEGTTDDGLRFMVMPFYAGKDLKAVLAEPVPLELALDIADQLLDALTGVHRADVVHRDLKPENVFVLAGQNGELRLVDFGIARLREGASGSVFQSSAGVISGSPAYVAPETITGDGICGRTDLYSFGVMFFQLLTGRLPLSAETPYDFLREHLVGVPLSLAQGKKGVEWDEDLEALMASLLAKERADRPASADQVRFRLATRRQEILDRAAGVAPPQAAAAPEGQSFFNRFFKR